MISEITQGKLLLYRIRFFSHIKFDKFIFLLMLSIFFIFLVSPKVSLSQTIPRVIELNHGCLYKGQNTAQKVVIKYPLRTDYVRLVNKISNYLGVNFEISLFEAKCDNAMATIINEDNIIVYDPDFLDKMINESGNNNAAELILAHEVGHLLDIQNLKGTKHNWWSELNADNSAGAYCFKAKVHSQVFYDVSQFFPKWEEMWNDKSNQRTHPDATSRIKSMVNGYWHQQLIGNSNKTSDEYPMDTLLFFLKTVLNNYNISTKNSMTYGYDIIDMHILKYFEKDGKRKSLSIPITKITSIELRPHDCGEVLFEVNHSFAGSEILLLGGVRTKEIYNTYKLNGWRKYMIIDDEKTTIEGLELLQVLTALIRDINSLKPTK